MEKRIETLERTNPDDDGLQWLIWNRDSQELLVDQEQRTRFIVQVSHGVVRQDIEIVGGQKQQNPNENFHAYFKTGKDGLDMRPVVQAAQDLVDVLSHREPVFQLAESGLRCTNSQSLGDGFTLEGCAAATIASQDCQNHFSIDGGDCMCATDDCQAREESSHDIFQVQDRIWMVASGALRRHVADNKYCANYHQLSLYSSMSVEACVDATLATEACSSGFFFYRQAGGFSHCYCATDDCQSTKIADGWTIYGIKLQDPKIHGFALSREEGEEILREASYIGCFKDKAKDGRSPRTLPEQLSGIYEGSISDCVRGCAGRGFPFAGLQQHGLVRYKSLLGLVDLFFLRSLLDSH